MITNVDLIFGVAIIILNLIPLFLREQKYFRVTIPLSLLLGAIRVLFMS